MNKPPDPGGSVTASHLLCSPSLLHSFRFNFSWSCYDKFPQRHLVGQLSIQSAAPTIRNCGDFVCIRVNLLPDMHPSSIWVWIAYRYWQSMSTCLSYYGPSSLCAMVVLPLWPLLFLLFAFPALSSFAFVCPVIRVPTWVLWISHSPIGAEICSLLTKFGCLFSIQHSCFQAQISCSSGIISGSAVCSDLVSFTIHSMCFICKSQVTLLNSLLFCSFILVHLQRLYVRYLVHRSLCLNSCGLGWLHASFSASFYVMGFTYVLKSDLGPYLLMAFLFAFLLSMSMVSGYKVEALWPKASPMTQSSDTYYGLFLNFLQWNSRLDIQIIVALCLFRVWFGLEKLGWYVLFCIHFV